MLSKYTIIHLLLICFFSNIIHLCISQEILIYMLLFKIILALSPLTFICNHGCALLLFCPLILQPKIIRQEYKAAKAL